MKKKSTTNEAKPFSKTCPLTESEFWRLVIQHDIHQQCELMTARSRKHLQAFADKNDMILMEDLELIPKSKLTKTQLKKFLKNKNNNSLNEVHHEKRQR